jgi:hypothetical protein
MEILKHTLSRKTIQLATKPTKKTPTQPIEMPLDNNSRTRIKIVRSIRIQKTPP